MERRRTEHSTVSDSSVTEPPKAQRNAVQRAPHRVDGRKFVVAALVLALLAVPLLGRYLDAYNYYLHLLFMTFMWIAMSSSWNIIGGFTGYISLGHSVFFAIGAYLSGALLVFSDLDPFLTAPLAGLAALVVGLVFGLITLRTRGPSFIISTIALMLAIRIGFDNWTFVGGSSGLSLPLPSFPRELGRVPFYYGMFLAAAGSVYLSYRVQRSKFGLGLRAISQDETKAEVAGINTRLYKILAFALSAFFVGVAGALWGYSLTYLRPTAFLSIGIAANMVLIAILGGRGTVAGPILGSVLLVAFNEFSVVQFGSTELNIAVTGGLLLVVLLFFAEGVVGTLREHNRLPRILDWD
jgi:branched-chain amino acid transport system permease protein